MENLPYLPGDESKRPAPLARYLPPLPEGIGAAFLAQRPELRQAERAAWILDPFGASPRLAIEMAAQGQRVLVAVNNPVTRFLLEMAANPASRADLSSALEELASAYKGNERLETHLQSLYLTRCARCQREVPAEAFIWERSTGSLVARIFHCPCGEGGEYPATEADQKQAAAMAATDGLHRARALERVAKPDDPDRTHAEEALECYLPRAVYALITIVNKLDSLSLDPAKKRALLALVLNACDEANALWQHPPERPRPKQLTIPARFLEKNVWLALERGVDLWSGNQQRVPLVNWPGMPGEAGGLCLFEGPIRNLAPHLKDLSISAVVTVLPRPNQAFWTLSALWAGWLWGQEAAAPFKSALRRRRYDWNWHASALFSALKNLPEHLPLNALCFGIIPEVEPAFLSAVLLAAAGSGLDLSGISLRSRQDPALVLWHRRVFTREDKNIEEMNVDSVRQAIRLALQERGEPAPYLFLHAAGLTGMASDHSLTWRDEAMAQIQASILEALADPAFVHHSDSPNPESGLWALVGWDDQTDPLPDRVEIAAVSFLQNNPACTFRDLETTLYSGFPGLMTPSLGLIRAVLLSYALETDGRWNLRPEDTPAARRLDLEEAGRSLAALGARLGYVTQWDEKNQRMTQWLENGSIRYHFLLLSSAVVERLLRQEPGAMRNNFLVLPGGRASLLAYKLERDPALRAAAGQWRILKFRHLRRLAGMTGLTRDRFEKEFAGDPIEPPEQMKMF